MQDYELRTFATPRAFEQWLSRNHAKAQGIRIQFARKASGIRSINYAEALDGQNRYAILYRLATAKRPETRARRLATFVEMLREGRKLHPRSSP